MRLRAAIVAGLAVGVGTASGVAVAHFDSITSNTGNTFAAAPDFVAPEAAASAILKGEGGEPGFVRPGGGYRVFARVTDTGAPASGVASVSADTGAGPFALLPGSFSADGVSYGFRSAEQTAPAWTAGARTASLTMQDTAGNARSSTLGFTVDATAPVPTDVQTSNNGASVGAPDAGDTITYGFSEPIDRESVIPGWTTAESTRPVVVRVEDGGLGSDRVRVFDSTNNSQIAALGRVQLGSLLYVLASRTYGATGTPSQITRTGNSYVVTLGTASATGLPLNGLVPGTMTWETSNAAFDRAGNRATTPAVNETGTSDVEF